MSSVELYEKISVLISRSRQSIVRSINQTIVYTYYEIGRMIVEEEQGGTERAGYGKQLVSYVSQKLTHEFGKGFSETNMKQMRSFYLIYSKGQTVSDEFEKSPVTSTKSIPNFQLSWSHYLKLMRMTNEDERKFYEIESINNNWSLRELQRQFDSALYERLALSRDKKGIKALATQGQIVEKPEDAIKDPFILEFTGLPERFQYSETELEQRLIDKLEHFLLELGKGFTFVGRQVRFTLDEKHFRVDLVFYNRLLQCFVLIDLKIGELKHQDLGQMQMYVNYYDRFVKLPGENKTIGIILCREKNKTLVEITLPEDNATIFASQYQTVLPSKEELKQLIENKNEWG
jgi:predicted nuclease of restriction endonuclease-like (RecB) superfamily